MKKNGEYVGVDEKFIPENEKYVDESLLGDKEKARKVAKRFGIGYLAIMLAPIIIFIVMAIFTTTQFNKVSNGGGRTDYYKVSNGGGRTDYYFEQYQGTQDGWDVRHILDKVVTHNKTNKYIVSVVYNGNTATSEEHLVAIKNQITNKEYEVSIGYDEKGRANKIEIINPASNLYTFNNLSGTKWGSELRDYLDDIITNNKLDGYADITVVYNEKSAITPDEILSIKNEISDTNSEDYEVSVDYADSFGQVVNKVTIKDIK